MGVARLQGFTCLFDAINCCFDAINCCFDAVKVPRVIPLVCLMRLKYRDRRALLWYFNRIKTTINRIKTTINRIKQTSKAVGV
jgi:hypothetical protein